MRLWLKYLIGIALGIIAALILPFQSVQAQSTLDFVVNLVIRFGRYTLLPVIFFSVATSFFKLRDEKLMLRTSLWTGGVIVASSLLLVLLGFISALVIKLPRVPIPVEKLETDPVLDIKGLIASIFPYSGFSALTDGAFLLPCFIFAGLAGAGAASDKTASKQAMSLFDSLSKVCYIVMSFFTEVLSIGAIAISCKWMVDFITITQSGVYVPLILMLTVDLLIVAFIIYPAILYFLCHDLHPYHVLYASICPFIVAFFSGDTNLTLALALRHGKESLGIRRRTNSTVLPLFSIFARGGAALVETVGFILILRSYTPLGLSAGDAFKVLGLSFGLSFVLGGLPIGGPFVAVFVMCKMFGADFASGYQLLKVAAPIICAYAAGFDALTAMFGSYIVAVKTKMIVHKDINQYI